MGKMRISYQCLEKCGDFLVAARGSNIDLFDLTNGSFLSTWQCPSSSGTSKPKTPVQEVISKDESQESKSSSVNIVVEASSPPAKRRKLSGEDQDETTTDNAKEDKGGKKNKKEKKQNNRLDSVASGLDTPAIIALVSTSDAQHVIAITGEDKSIRVFSIISQDGVSHLKQLSQRVMPKRPSALTLTHDNTTILSADKFGDVYSLPLLQPSVAESSTSTASTQSKPYKPSANELTIHSERNRKALANQKRQNHQAKAEKSAPDFEHSLLLGHVSLLTDVKLARSGERTYVITADRDEHIRVSRGIPQAHIIENFCLGHTEFISRICIPDSRPEILISGGGDVELYVWEWEKGLLVSKAELKALVQEVMGEEKCGKIAVSAICHSRQGDVDVVFVTVEGVPAVFTFHLTMENALKQVQVLELPGNPLSILSRIPSSDGSLSGVLVSIDNIHKSGSSIELRESSEDAVAPLLVFLYKDGVLVKDTLVMGAADGDSDLNEGSLAGLKNLLYGLENLRKRDGEERGGENGDVETGAAEDAVMAKGEAAQVDE